MNITTPEYQNLINKVNAVCGTNFTTSATITEVTDALIPVENMGAMHVIAEIYNGILSGLGTATQHLTAWEQSTATDINNLFE